MTATATHRKCFRRGSSTTDVTKDKCKCGGYMYLISQIYTPKIVKKEVAKSE